MRIAEPISVVVRPGYDFRCAIVGRSIAIVINLVAELRRTGMDGSGGVITIGSGSVATPGDPVNAVCIDLPISVRVLVAHGLDIAVFVVARRVANFLSTYVSGWIAIIAVIT
jgi:hypothetical protein